jgi:choline dehydrogenase-like flavoprotein
LSEVLIVGSGVGGATLAKELSQRGKKVTVLESGGYPKMGSEWKALNLYTGNLIGPGEFSGSGIEILRTVMVGGSSMATIGNGVRSIQKELHSAGIDLDDKFTEAEKELNIAPCPEENMGERTKRLVRASDELGYDMKPMPKFIDFSKCVGCGNCHLGCIYGAKWTSRNYLGEAYRNNAVLKTEHEVIEILHNGDEVKGVKVRTRDGVRELDSSCVVLSAGGIGTPIVLQNSGLEAGSHLFADTLITTFGVVKEARFGSELGMATIIDEFHDSEGYILSPFMEGPLDILTDRISFMKKLNAFNLNKIIGIMAKTKDMPNGRVNADGTIKKPVPESDQRKIDKGYERSRQILIEAGAEPKSIFRTHIRGGHPGGTAGIGRVIDKNLETEIQGLYVCDCSAFPAVPGKPPVLTIIALSKYLAQVLSEKES